VPIEEEEEEKEEEVCLISVTVLYKTSEPYNAPRQ